MTLYVLDGLAPDVDPAAWVAANAVVLGAVTLARDSSVWFGAVLRGDNERITVGAGSNVQDNAVLHTDIGFPLDIGENVTVGHLAILHGCTVGDGTLIGMGACILNGVRIGRSCIIGAKALVAEGKTIPDHSVVLGVPGRVTGEARPEQIQRALSGARHYVENARRFRQALRPQGSAPEWADGSRAEPSV